MKTINIMDERTASFAQTPARSVISMLGSSDEGLSSGEVDMSRTSFGSNGPAEAEMPMAERLKASFISPLSVIFLAAAAMMTVIEAARPEGFISFFVISFALVCAFMIRGWGRYIKRFGNIRRQEGYAEVMREGTWSRIDHSDIVVGDMVRLGMGSEVPADMRLYTATGLIVSEEALTGDHEGCTKTTAVMDERPERIEDCGNMVFRGSRVLEGRCEGVVVNVGKRTLSSLREKDIQ